MGRTPQARYAYGSTPEIKNGYLKLIGTEETEEKWTGEKFLNVLGTNGMCEEKLTANTRC